MGGAGQEAAPAGEAEDERTLAKALTEIVIRLDLSEEASMRLPTPVIALLQDRQALAALINEYAQEGTDPERHLTARKAPETLGLLV